MFPSKIANEDITCLIESFTGPNYWKLQFSAKVLPRLNKKWKLVGRTQSYGDYLGNEPCSNCYAYGNGIDIGCLNNPNCCDSSMTVWVKKEDVFDHDWWTWIFSGVVLRELKSGY